MSSDLTAYYDDTSDDEELNTETTISRSFPHDLDLAKAQLIFDEEDKIDPDDKLYLITFNPNPDPSEMPDVDFETQHEATLELMTNFLYFCRCGLFCVETTQQGFPHYHGWYQSYDDERERGRIIAAKVMKRFGLVKITPSIGKYRPGKYSEHANCLYYYKADVFGQMRWIEQNPISKDTKSRVDINDINIFFHIKGRKSWNDLHEKMVQRDYYRKFYYDTKSIN